MIYGALNQIVEPRRFTDIGSQDGSAKSERATDDAALVEVSQRFAEDCQDQVGDDLISFTKTADETVYACYLVALYRPAGGQLEMFRKAKALLRMLFFFDPPTDRTLRNLYVDAAPNAS